MTDLDQEFQLGTLHCKQKSPDVLLLQTSTYSRYFISKAFWCLAASSLYSVFVCWNYQYKSEALFSAVLVILFSCCGWFIKNKQIELELSHSTKEAIVRTWIKNKITGIKKTLITDLQISAQDNPKNPASPIKIKLIQKNKTWFFLGDFYDKKTVTKILELFDQFKIKPDTKSASIFLS